MWTKQKYQWRERKSKKKPQRNHKAEKYNWNENSAKGIQRQIWVGRTISELEDRKMKIMKSEKENEKKLKKSEHKLRNLLGHQ